MKGKIKHLNNEASKIRTKTPKQATHFNTQLLTWFDTVFFTILTHQTYFRVKFCYVWRCHSKNKSAKI